MSSQPTPLLLSQETKDAYKIYLRYNKEIANTLPERFPITKLVRKHIQWKALKLAGAFAIFSCHHKITLEDFTMAVSYVESIESHMKAFEIELVKEKYEVFSDYMQSRAEDGQSSITLHAMKKLNYITGTGNTKTRMDELVKLSSSYDPDGIYTVKDNSVYYELIRKTNVTGASFLAVTGTKAQRAQNCATGYSYADTTFPKLKNLLCNDLAFSPFEFKGGNRGRDNVIGGTKWLCLDVDKSILTYEEVDYILQDINHHIAKTSDDTNEYKFRLVVELDAVVTLDSVTWPYFITSIGDFLQLDIDRLPQSSIFFGYEGRKVLSVTDQTPISIKEHVQFAISEANEKTPDKEYSKAEKEKMISNTYTTFEQAFNAEDGEGSRKLFWAARKAHGLGMDTDKIIELVNEISEYWVSALPPHRLQALERQIRAF